MLPWGQSKHNAEGWPGLYPSTTYIVQRSWASQKQWYLPAACDEESGQLETPLCQTASWSAGQLSERTRSLKPWSLHALIRMVGIFPLLNPYTCRISWQSTTTMAKYIALFSSVELKTWSQTYWPYWRALNWLWWQLDQATTAAG